VRFALHLMVFVMGSIVRVLCLKLCVCSDLAGGAFFDQVGAAGEALPAPLLLEAKGYTGLNRRAIAVII
jgi:hypothetical protein